MSNGYTIIIPSKNVKNLFTCLSNIVVNTARPTPDVVVVDDGLEYPHPDAVDFIKSNAGIIPGEKPFCFARNVNLGIAAANPDHDIVILNDDAIMVTPGGFDLMRAASMAYAPLPQHAQQQPQHLHRSFGILSATTDLAGNPQQQPNRNHFGPRIVKNIHGHSAPVVAFVCVYIRREVIRAIGLLDERFGGDDPVSGQRIYGFDDNDYCRRAFGAGFQIGVVDGVYVDHGQLQPTFRKHARAAGDIEVAQQIYLRKWGKL